MCCFLDASPHIQVPSCITGAAGAQNRLGLQALMQILLLHLPVMCPCMIPPMLTLTPGVLLVERLSAVSSVSTRQGVL